jgi:hypothetical protein
MAMTEFEFLEKTRKMKYYNRGQLLREGEREISGSGRVVGFVFGARTQAVGGMNSLDWMNHRSAWEEGR